MDVREIKGRFQKLSYGYVARFLGFVRAMTVPRCLMAVWLLCLRENGLQRLKAYPPPHTVIRVVVYQRFLHR